MSPVSSAHDEPVPRPQRRGRPGRSVSLDEAMAAIPDRSRVFVSAGCGAPLAVLDAMAAARDRWSSLELVADYLLEPIAPFDHPNEPFRLTTLQPSRALAAMRSAGALSTIPSSLRQWRRLLAEDGPLPIDVALVHVSPPGPEGRFSLGVNVALPVEVMAAARLVIAQVNPRMPYTFGAGELERDEIDLLVDVDHPLAELPPAAIDDTARAIGALVADEIGDGSVIQLGIGGIPEAVLAALASHRDLGVHSGMIGDSVVDLHTAGALSGARKSTWPGRIVTGTVMGTVKSFDFAHRNPDVLLVPSSISHGLDALARLERLVAINSAIEVALDGSVNAEAAGESVLSGPGGQPDFATGAGEAPGGRSIIALPSTAAGGKRSRIVPRLAAGAPVTVPRYLVDTVVTEHGTARLAGLSLDQRAAALRAIAHPDFGPTLDA